MKAAPPRQEVFVSSYDRVWRAIQLALSQYPIAVNDVDMGVIETEYIRGEKAWMSPPATRPMKGGYRYKVIVRALKGTDAETLKSIVRVTISKQSEMQKDFFSNYESQPSDGLEELSITYRVKRELMIESAIKKAQDRQSQKDAIGDPDF